MFVCGVLAFLLRESGSRQYRVAHSKFKIQSSDLMMRRLWSSAKGECLRFSLIKSGLFSQVSCPRAHFPGERPQTSRRDRSQCGFSWPRAASGSVSPIPRTSIGSSHKTSRIRPQTSRQRSPPQFRISSPTSHIEVTGISQPLVHSLAEATKSKAFPASRPRGIRSAPGAGP